MLRSLGPLRALRRGFLALARPASIVAALAGSLAGLLMLASLGLPPSAVVALLGMSAARADVPAQAPVAPRATASPPPAASPLPSSLPAGPQRLEVGGRAVIAIPPSPPAAGAPLAVVLHGMCSDPDSMCALYASVDRSASWLLCPAGNGACPGGAPDWTGPPAGRAAAVDAATDAFDRAFRSDAERSRPALLAGYSRGAFTARDIAYLRPGRYGALVLLCAAISPDPARLKASGVRRVLLASGDFDGARVTMLRAARTLTAADLPARFMSLGAIGHSLPADLGERIGEGVRWASEAVAE